MIRKYVVTLEDTLQGWQEDENELERKYGAEPLDCGNCEIVQASISTGIRTTSRLVDDVLDKIRVKIEGYKSTIDNAISEDELKIEGMKEAYADCLKIIDKYKAESEDKK